jgi:3-dehydroquinate synthetase
VEASAVLAAIERDKKAGPGGVRFVLVERPGEITTGAAVDDGMVSAAVEELMSQ